MIIIQRDEPTGRYTRTAKVFHWVILALIVVQFFIAWTMPDISRGTQPIGLIAWHLSMGTAILFVVLARIIWRTTHPAPPPSADLSPLLQFVSRTTHFLLYALLVVLPLMGWANASSRGWSVHLFGAIPLPALLSKGSSLGRQMGDLHGTTAIVLLAVVALHVTGALYHAIILRDDTLKRML